MVERYPPWERIASPTELKQKYESARNEIINYKKMAQMANATSKSLAKDKHKYKNEAKVASKQLVRLTKKQKATDEAKKAGYWSGAATIGVTILYEGDRVSWWSCLDGMVESRSSLWCDGVVRYSSIWMVL